MREAGYRLSVRLAGVTIDPDEARRPEPLLTFRRMQTGLSVSCRLGRFEAIPVLHAAFVDDRPPMRPTPQGGSPRLGSVTAADGPLLWRHREWSRATERSKGAVDEHHPLSAGVLGSLVGPRSLGHHTAALVRDADLVILIGTRTNQNGTDSWRQIPPGAKVIHIDVDPQEIGRNYQALRLVGDAGETLRELFGLLNERDLSRRRSQRAAAVDRISECWRQFDQDRYPFVHAATTPIRPERVMAELQALLTPQTTVVADASYSSMWVAGQLRSLAPGMRFLTPRGLAGLGWGLPLALGAKAARPNHAVVTLVGDGGFAHSWAEIETMVRCDLPVTIILLNNGILGFQRDAETVKFGRFTSACHFSPVDHAQIAEACGCPAVRVEDPAELRAHLQRGLAGRGPLFIEVMTDPNAHPPLSLFAGMDAAA